MHFWHQLQRISVWQTTITLDFEHPGDLLCVFEKKNFDFHRGWKPAAKPQPLDCSPLEGYLKTTSNQMIWLNIAEDIITGSYIGQVPSKN
jgi:hypothetical protein